MEFGLETGVSGGGGVHIVVVLHPRTLSGDVLTTEAAYSVSCTPIAPRKREGDLFQ